MKKWLKRIAISFTLAILLSPSLLVLAIDSPDEMDISNVWAYRHCLEDNDRLFVIEYNIDYTTNPDEGANEAFIARLMDGITELKADTPYDFQDNGYGVGIIMLYFTAAEATALPVTWEGAYTVKLMGNPTLSWSGAVPEDTINSWFWSSSTDIYTTKEELSARILALAGQLESLWSLDMIESVGSSNKLTSYGETYFSSLVANFREMAPYAFSGQTIDIDFNYKTYAQTYANTLAASPTGTPFDVSGAATSWGSTTMFLSSMIWIGFTIGVIIVASMVLGAKPASLLAVPMIVGGSLLGMLPLVVSVIMGVLAFILSGYVLFYQKSGA